MSKGAAPRTIVVDGRTYRWVVRKPVGATGAEYPGFVVVDVWNDEDRGAGQHLQVRVRWDDPWVNFGAMIGTPAQRREAVWATAPVTPARVAAWIRAGVSHGWRPTAKGAALLIEAGEAEGGMDQPA